MKNCVFLIILLGFIRDIFCCSDTRGNNSEDVCTVSWFRRKRAVADYTRWRFNIETTPEFIVKVLDDEVQAGTSDRLAAVNIMPVTKRAEKIIVGGAIVPTAATTSTSLPRDYTRFMPPTVKASTEVQKEVMPYRVTTPAIPRDFIQPISVLPNQTPVSVVQHPFFPPNPPRNAYRDESPPNEPQFLQRSHAQEMAPPRQYAPVAPVAFTRRTTGTPLKPPVYGRYQNDPTRSTSAPGPTRTLDFFNKIKNMEDFPILEAIVEHHPGNDMFVTRTTPTDVPSRTTLRLSTTKEDFFDDETEHLYSSATIKKFLESQLNELEENSSDQSKNENPSYNNDFFYNSDIKTGNNKKPIDINGKIQDDDTHEQENQIGSNRIILEDPNPEILGDIKNDTADVQYPEDSLDINDDKESKQNVGAPDTVSRDRRRPVCNLIKLRPLNFNSPRTLPEIVAQMKQWTEESPVAKWADITGGNLTTMENPIYVVTVDDPSVGQVASEKHNILLVAGINGRDHHAVSAAMFVLYQLIERSDTHHDLLSKYRFLVIPVFNPDGYDYSMTFPHRRNWVKNLRQNWEECEGRESCQHCSTYGIRCIVSSCYGVNLDRNFEYQWIPPNELRLEHPCGNLYAGARQMSELETQSLNTYLHEQHISISVFIAFKEGDILGVMYPYSHTKKRRAFDQIYRQRADRAAAAASSISGRKYRAGQTSQYLPLYAGGIEDWADGHLGIDDTYTIMMFRPVDMPRSNYLAERVIHEAYAAMDSLLLSTLTHTKPGGPVMFKSSRSTALRPDFGTVLLVFGTSFITYLYNVTYCNVI